MIIKPSKLSVVSIIILSVLLVAFVYSILTPIVSISNIGIVKTIGLEIYWDVSLTNRTTQIDWGMIEPGMNKTVILYVLNPGTVDITLTGNVSSWTPINASQYITLTMNYTGQIIRFYEVLPITLTLSVAPDITGINEFSFIITVIGVEKK